MLIKIGLVNNNVTIIMGKALFRKVDFQRYFWRL